MAGILRYFYAGFLQIRLEGKNKRLWQQIDKLKSIAVEAAMIQQLEMQQMDTW